MAVYDTVLEWLPDWSQSVMYGHENGTISCIDFDCFFRQILLTESSYAWVVVANTKHTDETGVAGIIKETFCSAIHTA